MITLEQVKEITFRKANLGGYRPEDVNAFIDEVVAAMEQNKKDKIDLIKKLDILAKRIEEYRKDEESVKGAVLKAQKLTEDTQKEADTKASEIIRKAEAQAIDIVNEANATVVNQKNTILKLQADAVVLREQLLETYNNHIRMIESLPTSSDITAKKKELDNNYPTQIASPEVQTAEQEVAE